MKQTAVEWLINTLFNESTVVVTQENNPILFEVLEQAKQMEKEQIVEARMDGINSALKGYAISNEQYYNETYKNK